jgi:hypothetical protein
MGWPLIGGIGKGTALIALVLYCLLPIVSNTVTGLNGVDPVLRDAGIAMGMTPRQLLWRVELPLAAVPGYARRVESLGFDGLHVAETIHDSLAVALLALEHTSRITVRTDVPETMRNYLLERRANFPGVDVDRTYLRRYPEPFKYAPGFAQL